MHISPLSLLIVLLIAVTSVRGTHFRGGTTTWSAAADMTVTFTSTLYWNYTYTPNRFRFYFGDGTDKVIFLPTTANNTDRGYATIHTTFKHKYTSPGTYYVFASNCCRISNLRGGAHDKKWEVGTTVVVDGIYRVSPTISLPPMIDFGIGENHLKIDSSLSGTFSYSSKARSRLPYEIYGASIGSPTLTPDGLLSWTTSSNDIGLWALQIKLETVENGVVVVDFIIDVEPVDVYSAPVAVKFVPEIQNYAVTPGTPISFQVQCISSVKQPVSVSFNNLLLSDMTFDGLPVVDISTTTNSTNTFTWENPKITNDGTSQSFVIPFTCVAENKLSDTKQVTINIASPLTCEKPSDASISCYGNNIDPPSYQHGCPGTADVTYKDPEDPSSCDYEFTRVWTYSNQCGQTVTASQKVKVDDKKDPEFTDFPSDKKLKCYAELERTNTGVPAATDSCTDVTITSSYSSSNKESNCENTVTKEFVAKDKCGNNVKKSQEIYVNDDVDPEISDLKDLSFACPTDIVCQPVASDNCGDADLTYSDLTDVPSCGVFTRRFTAKDSCGNKATKDVEITIGHKNDPVIKLGNARAVTCKADVALLPPPSALSFCKETILPTLDSTDYTKTGSAGTCISEAILRWNARDNCNNTITVDEHVSVVDSKPDIDVPGDQLVEACSDYSYKITSSATAIDTCDGPLDVSHTDSDAPKDTCGGAVRRTWSATDSCGNSVSGVQIINVKDTTGPTIVIKDYVGQCIGELDVTISGSPVVTDCQAQSDITVKKWDNSLSPNGKCGNVQGTRKWSAQDKCGNSNEASQQITIQDNTVPTIKAPADATVECESKANPDLTGYPTVYDNCGLTDVKASYVDTKVSDTLISREWKIVDYCGNEAKATQNIAISSNLPELSVPADVSAECSKYSQPEHCGSATGKDSCGGNVDISYTDATTGTCPKTVRRTWKAVHKITGKITTGDQVITVGNSKGPIINSPDDVEVSCAHQVGSGSGVTAVDSCDGTEYSVSVSDSVSGSAPKDQTVTRTYTSVDNCGNRATKRQIISVKDKIKPTITFGPKKQVSCAANADPDTVGAPTVSDNCNEAADKQNIKLTYSDDQDKIAKSCSGSITRTWKATDAAGNYAEATESIDVVPTPPTFTCVPDSAISVACFDDFDYGIPKVKAVDSCGKNVDVKLTTKISDGSCPQTITRTWTATDSCGNSADFVQTITVNDKTKPTFGNIASVEVECLSQVSGVAPQVSDNCKGVGKPTFTDSTPSNTCPSSITRTWSVKDACGNIATATQSITIRKKSLPNLKIPSIKTIQCGDDMSATDYGTGSGSAVDCCGNTVPTKYTDTVSLDIGLLNVRAKVISRNFVANDDCGNSAQKSQKIIILPDLPTISLPPDFTASCSQDTSPTSAGTAKISSKCGSDLTVQFKDDKTCSKGGFFYRTWAAVDGDGNVVVSDKQKITIKNCNPDGTEIQGLDKANGPIPLTIYPSIDLSDANFPCEKLTLVWYWGDGSKTVQECSTDAPNNCVITGSKVSAKSSKTYNNDGTYAVKLLVYDSRATSVPSDSYCNDIDDNGQLQKGDGWLLFYADNYVTAYDMTQGFVTGGPKFSMEGGVLNGVKCTDDSTKSGCSFNAKFAQTGPNIKSQGNLECQFRCTAYSSADFKSTDLTKLTLYASKPPSAMWTGTGTVKADGKDTTYSFSVFVVDGDSKSGDSIRVQITNAKGQVIIDNAAGDFMTTSNSKLSQGGQITIHKPPPVTVSALEDEIPMNSNGSGSGLSVTGVIAIAEAVVIVAMIVVVVVLIAKKTVAVPGTSSADSYGKM